MYRIFIREIRRQTHSNWVFPIISPAHATMQDCWIGANKVHHPEDDKTNSSESFDVWRGYKKTRISAQTSYWILFKKRINVNKL